MADVAQLVRASVCGTECRRFESGYPPHKIQPHQNGGVKFYQGGPDENRRFDKIAGENKHRDVRAVAIWKGAHKRSKVGIYNPVIRPIKFNPTKTVGLNFTKAVRMRTGGSTK